MGKDFYRRISTNKNTEMFNLIIDEGHANEIPFCGIQLAKI